MRIRRISKGNQIAKILFISVFFVVVLLISGCYESRISIIDRGEKVDIVGSFRCEKQFIGSESIISFSEQKNGYWPLAGYTYVDSDGDNHIFSKLPSGLFLIQTKAKEERFTYAFIDFIDSDTFFVLIPDCMGKEAYIEQLFKKHEIQHEQRAESIIISGDKNKLYDFLASHDKSILSVAAKFEKIKK